jgi:hypothetical protein
MDAMATMTAPAPAADAVFFNTAAKIPRGDAPALTIASPFYRYCPEALLRCLAAAPATLPIEAILFDDGGGDAGLVQAIAMRLERAALPARLMISAENLGRAAARNRLAQAARGRHILFLDADMAPERQGFFERWLDLIEAEDPAVAFGGFDVPKGPVRPEHKLHWDVQRKGDCIPAARRRRSPALSLATSNLLVRRDLALALPFDAHFAGWGFEDSEWALRADAQVNILHVDNPATHLGLDAPGALLAKYAGSALNFARLCARHPAAMRQAPIYRAARAMKALPAQHRLRPLLKAAACGPLPLPARRLALKLYRASHAAEHLP